MKDEIKEILDKLKDTADTSFFAVCGSQEELDKMPKSITKILSIPSKDAQLLLDYIINLQEEIQDLKADYGSKAQVERDILQERNEKAIEYINKMTEKEINEIEYNGEKFVVCGSDFGEGAYIIKSILEGDDKE